MLRERQARRLEVFDRAVVMNPMRAVMVGGGFGSRNLKIVWGQELNFGSLGADVLTAVHATGQAGR